MFFTSNATSIQAQGKLVERGLVMSLPLNHLAKLKGSPILSIEDHIYPDIYHLTSLNWVTSFLEVKFVSATTALEFSQTQKFFHHEDKVIFYESEYEMLYAKTITALNLSYFFQILY